MNNIYIKKYLKYKKKYLNLKGGTLLRTERPLDNLSNTFIQVTIHGKTDSNKDNVFKIPENILLSMIDCCGSTAMQTINYWFDHELIRHIFYVSFCKWLVRFSKIWRCWGRFW